jgi:putative intracellular protease/amidase
MARTIWMPLPDRDFDVTEVSVPWKLFTEAGHRVRFASESGQAPAADPLLIHGVVFGALGAAAEPLAFYRELEQRPEFTSPARWAEVAPASGDALVLPGGHAPGMRQYLGSAALQRQVAAFWASGKPVGAICHGVLVLARAGVLKGHRTTCLPKYMERTAFFLTAWRHGNYYRTYPAYVEDEVRAALASSQDFVRGPLSLISKGSRSDDSAAFVVEDGSYVSARWPGDAYLFAKKILERL